MVGTWWYRKWYMFMYDDKLVTKRVKCVCWSILNIVYNEKLTTKWRFCAAQLRREPITLKFCHCLCLNRCHTHTHENVIKKCVELQYFVWEQKLLFTPFLKNSATFSQTLEINHHIIGLCISQSCKRKMHFVSFKWQKYNVEITSSVSTFMALTCFCFGLFDRHTFSHPPVPFFVTAISGGNYKCPNIQTDSETEWA